MSLEEKLRALAKKGELVHLSLAASGKGYRCVYTAASPAGGHAFGEAVDPVEAIEAAFKASPVKMPRVTKPRVTGAVKEPDPTEPDRDEAGRRGFSKDWTKP